ncbi:VWA domain-containing protein [Chlamydiota bacterium]
MKFLHPVLLNLLLLIPFLVLLFFLAEKRRGKKIKSIGDKILILRMAQSVSVKKRRGLFCLQLVIVFLLILILARPQIGTQPKEVRQKGVDVVVLIDTSESMGADDFKPSRIERARQEVSDFIDSLRGHRIGLVAFAGSAFVLSPLTIDYSALKIYLDILDTKLIPYQGTVIGAALEKAANLFNKKHYSDKVIVLITDGEDHEGKVIEICKRLKKENIIVFTIGVGREKGVPISVFDNDGKKIGLKKDVTGAIVMSKLNKELLVKISEMTGGAYFTASTRGLELKKIKAEIDKKEGHAMNEKLLIHYEDRYHVLLLMVLLLWLIIFISGERKGLYAFELVKRMKKLVFIITLFFSLFLSQSFAFMAVSDEKTNEANELFVNEKYDEALAAYDALLEEHPDANEIIVNRANVFYRKGEFENALNEYLKGNGSEKIFIKSASLYNTGNVFFRQEKYTEALNYYKNALKVTPDDRDIKYNLEVTLQKIAEQRAQKEKKKDSQEKDKKKGEKESQEQKSSPQEADNEKNQKKGQSERKEKEENDDTSDKQAQEIEDEKRKEKEKENKQEQEKEGASPEEKKEKSKQSTGQQTEEDSDREMKKKEAYKVLDALKENEKELQRTIMQRRIEKPEELVNEKDW